MIDLAIEVNSVIEREVVTLTLSSKYQYKSPEIISSVVYHIGLDRKAKKMMHYKLIELSECPVNIITYDGFLKNGPYSIDELRENKLTSLLYTEYRSGT